MMRPSQNHIWQSPPDDDSVLRGKQEVNQPKRFNLFLKYHLDLYTQDYRP